MATTKTTDSFFSQTIDYKRSTACWIACPISTINSAITSNIPTNAKITGLKLNVQADFDSVSANVYLQYGFGSSTSISKHLLNSSGSDTKMTSTSPLWYPSDGVDITSYIKSNVSPFSLKTDNGSYVAFRFYSTNIALSKYKITAITLTITYDTIYTVTPMATPTEGGTITGGGNYLSGSTATVTAVPNEGYKFVGWANQSGVVTTTNNPYSFTVNADTTFSAIFELDRINLILIDTSQSLGVIIDTDTKDDDEVYVDKTKVYG